MPKPTVQGVSDSGVETGMILKISDQIINFNGRVEGCGLLSQWQNTETKGSELTGSAALSLWAQVKECCLIHENKSLCSTFSLLNTANRQTDKMETNG